MSKKNFKNQKDFLLTLGVEIDKEPHICYFRVDYYKHVNNELSPCTAYFEENELIKHILRIPSKDVIQITFLKSYNCFSASYKSNIISNKKNK